VTAPLTNPRSLGLPAGEPVLWQGRPNWRALALHAFHARKVAIYFAILAIWRAASDLANGDSVASPTTSALWLLLLGGAAVVLLTLMAWLTSRTTLYTITSRRVVMQFGVALPMTLNIPLRLVGSAAVKTYTNGTGDIPLSISGGDRIAYLVLWPHARPWRAARAEPMLRAVPDAKRAADVLATALKAVAAGTQRSSPEAVGVSATVEPPSPAQPSAAAA
jgi:Bacterial PH domain